MSNTVVPPSEAAVELGDGHQLNQRDPNARELLQLLQSARPCPFARKGAGVELVDDCPFRSAPGQSSSLHW
jgi:hypothetical protein